MLLSLSNNHISHQPKLCFKATSLLSGPLLVLAPMPEHDKQQPLANKSPPDESYTSPLEELRVYSRCLTSKTISDPPCQRSDLDLGNTTSISKLNSSIPVVDDIGYVC
jgi:hypothetical protein